MAHLKIQLSANAVKEIKSICLKHSNNPLNLINVLHDCQNSFGCLSEEIQELISQELHIPVSKIYGVVTFYSFFTMKPKGKHHISVCTGTACFVKGSENILNEFIDKLNIQVGETSEDGRYTLTTLRCVGACGLAPVVLVDDKVYGKFKIEDVSILIDKLNIE